ncbi:hypothetical protein OROMI_019158 [Orobanche minor]
MPQAQPTVPPLAPRPYNTFATGVVLSFHNEDQRYCTKIYIDYPEKIQWSWLNVPKEIQGSSALLDAADFACDWLQQR